MPRRAVKVPVPGGGDSAPSELAGTLDEVRATVIAVLASLKAKEKTLRERVETAPSAGVLTGLSDIQALRAWGTKTLRTIEVLNRGQSGEISALLSELGEFREILHAHEQK